VQEHNVLQSLVNGQIPSLRDESTGAVDPELEQICTKAIAPRPEDRYPTAVDLQLALERWSSSSGQAVAARDVGRHIAELFVEERMRLKGLIEQQLHDVRWSGTYPRLSGVDLPQIHPGRISVTPTGPTGAASMATGPILLTSPARRSNSTSLT